MILDILSSYSTGELNSLIGQDYVSGFEKITGADIERKYLENAVYTKLGFNLVTNKNERERLIERMSPDQVSQVLDFIANKTNIEFHEGIDPYSALSYSSSEFPDLFVEVLGFSDQLKLNATVNESVKGIINVSASYPAYPYQRDMINTIKNLAYSQVSSCLLHLPTGAGKTRTAMNIASEHLRENENGLVLWLADTSELCSQAAQEFARAWSSLGNRDIKIYSYFSDTNISLGGIDSGFLVAGLQKLNAARGSKDYSILYDQLSKYVTLVIFDEAHKAIAPTYAQTVNEMANLNQNTFILGLTATPGRRLEHNSDEDKKLSRFFQGNKVTMKIKGYESPIKYLVDNKYLARANFLPIDYDSSKITVSSSDSGLKLSDEIRQVLSEDNSRNVALLKVISREVEQGSSIIVFACSVEHSRDLAAYLSFMGIRAYSLDSRYDNDQTRRFKIADYSSGKTKVLVNYNILTAGFDAPITNVAIIARPTDSLVQYSQMAGRAMRGLRSGGNFECNIYTVRDDIPAFTSVAKAFSHWDSLWNEV